MFVIPFTMLIYVNARIVSTLRHSATSRQTMTQNGVQQALINGTTAAASGRNLRTIVRDNVEGELPMLQ